MTRTALAMIAIYSCGISSCLALQLVVIVKSSSPCPCSGCHQGKRIVATRNNNIVIPPLLIHISSCHLSAVVAIVLCRHSVVRMLDPRLEPPAQEVRVDLEAKINEQREDEGDVERVEACRADPGGHGRIRPVAIFG